MSDMKKFVQKLGIIAASGLIFGGLAGVSFTGTRAGITYVSEVVSQQPGKENEDGKQKDNEDNKSELSENNVQIGSDNTIRVSLHEDSQLYNIADLAEQVMPSIVSISSTIIYQNPYAYFYGGEMERTVTGCGSGVIIGEDEERLLIATNNHVVEGTDSITVAFCDDTDVEAEIVGTDGRNDLAVVSVKKEDIAEDTLNKLKIAELGDSNATRVGEPAIAIGNALGYGQSVTVGYISALNKTVTINNASINMIQTDAAINEGNSGGALLNLQGQLIGINSAKASNMHNNVEGMGYAIPISNAIPIIQSIIEGTQSSVAFGSAYMGIQGKDLSAYDAASFNMPQGIYLLAVVEGAPADQAGLQSGDVITALDGTNVTAMSEVKSILADKSPEDEIVVTFYRSDQRGNYEEQSVTVILGNYVE